MEKRQWLGSKTVNRNQIANRAGHRDGQTSHADGMTNPDRLAEVQAVAAQLTATGNAYPGMCSAGRGSTVPTQIQAS